MAENRISIIMPVLNEAAGIRTTLAPLQAWRAAGHELIIVDGGSNDSTLEQAAGLADKVISGPTGRARQMDTGATHARHAVLLFLHADTLLPVDAMAQIQAAVDEGAHWGHFRLRLSGRRKLLRVIERAVTLRTRVSGVVTGDMGMFVTREAFGRVAGFGQMPLMEDIAISRRLKRLGRPRCLEGHVLSSSRRWEERGLWRTILLMWRLRLAYFFGVDPAQLVRAYYPDQSGKQQP